VKLLTNSVFLGFKRYGRFNLTFPSLFPPLVSSFLTFPQSLSYDHLPDNYPPQKPPCSFSGLQRRSLICRTLCFVPPLLPPGLFILFFAGFTEAVNSRVALLCGSNFGFLPNFSFYSSTPFFRLPRILHAFPAAGITPFTPWCNEALKVKIFFFPGFLFFPLFSSVLRR